MPTPEQIKQEQIRREIARRQASQYQEGAIDKLPWIGPHVFKPINEAANRVFGSPPTMSDLPDASRIAANSITLQGNDYLTNKILGNTKATEATQAARDRTGWGGTALDVGAGVLTPTGLPKKIVEGGRLLSTAGHAVSAGVQGAADAYMGDPNASLTSPETLKRMGIAGLESSGASAALSSVAEPVLSWLSRRKVRQETLDKLPYRTKDDLALASDQHYADVRDSKAVYKGQDLQALQAAMQRLKMTKGYDKPDIILRNEIIRDHFSRGKDLSLDELDKVRQYIRNTAFKKGKVTKPGKAMIKELDKFQQNAQAYTPPANPRGRYTVDPDTYAKQIEARRLFMQKEKMQLADDAVREAKRKASIGRGNPFAPSPEATDVREFSKISKSSDTGKRTLTPLEDAQVKKLEEGTRFRNFAQTLEPYSFRGKFGGPVMALGGGLGFFPVVGHASSAMLAAGAGAADLISQMGRKSTANQIEDLRSIIADPKGVGAANVKADPVEVARKKAEIARLAASAARNYSNRGPR